MRRPTSGLFPESGELSQEPPAPASAWVTAHTDGGARGNPGPAGYGVAVTDAEGRKIAELSEFLGVKTNNVAEYSALLAALAWAEANRRSHLRVVSDSELMVKQIQGKYKVASPDLRPLFEEARRRIARLDGFEIRHALRHQNKIADGLANQAMDLGMGRNPQPALGAGRVLHASVIAPPHTPVPGTILRGFVRGGAIHLLGGASLPDGRFVKVIPEE